MRFIFFITMLIQLLPTHAQTDYSQYVNPFIGTGGHGHTYPGAVYPFGMMQLSPDTRLDGWDGCGGYHYSDSIIYGFSHTHLSGTGVSDYGDLLIKPFSDAATSPYATLGKLKTTSRFSHRDEYASPGYYSVHFPDDQIQVSLTTTARCGMHFYTFGHETRNKILIDLEHRDEVTYSKLTFENDSTISGVRFSKAWAVNQKFYFVIRLSEPVRHKYLYLNDTLQQGVSSVIGTDLKAILFLPDTCSHLLLKVGISATSIEGARKNLDTEIPTWNFNQTKEETRKAWNDELGKIDFRNPDLNTKMIFYSALYHTMIVPNLYEDVDRQYLGRDFEIHKAAGYDVYTVFSLWDTYRGYHPLMSIIDRGRTRDWVLGFLGQYQQANLLPIWEFASNETFCMIGNHSIPVIADAIMKGLIENPDTQRLLLDAMVKTSEVKRAGMEHYMNKGYIPADKESESVSKTLEYAFDDWCVAMTAKHLGDSATYRRFIKRAQSYKNLYNPLNGFHQPKANGSFLSPFDPREVTFHYTEANGWQYNFYVPQDISGYMALLGSEKRFTDLLDTMFMSKAETTGRDQADITGLIGQYAHGNEPSHHMAYLYAYAGQSWKTQQRCHEIMNNLYFNAPDGLSGNEDCGQMSAWYVLNALGFYPVNPADGIFIFGSPQCDESTIRLENGNSFTIKTVNRSKDSPYIQSIRLNGQPYTRSYITYNDLMKGGVLEFTMGPQPQTSFGSALVDRPVSKISAESLTPAPFALLSEGKVFEKKNTISLVSPVNAPMEYQILPDESWKPYRKPISVKTTSWIQFRHCGSTQNEMVQVVRRNTGRSVTLFQTYNTQYTGGGDQALVDGERGGADFRTGGWQGYQHTDVTFVVDLGKAKKVESVALSCLQEANSWIWMPRYAEFWYSTDNEHFIYLGKVTHEVPEKVLTPLLYELRLRFPAIEARYIKVFAKQYGTIPEWHLGKGGQSWIFVDEIVVE